MKKFLAIAVAMLMVLAMSSAVFATPAPTGTITVQNPTAGHTYTPYKIFDVTLSGNTPAYTIAANSQFYDDVAAVADPEQTPKYFALTEIPGTNPAVYSVSVVPGVQEAEIIGWLEGLDYSDMTPAAAAVTATDANNDVAWTLPYGYYVVTVTGAAGETIAKPISVDTTTPNAVIYDKNDAPGLPSNAKQVSDNGNTGWGDFNSAQIGDIVFFRITAHTPEYEGTDEIMWYTFTDTLGDGFTYNANSMVVTLGGVTLDQGTDWTLTQNGNVLTITINADDISPYPNDPTLVITYNATVDADAAYDNVNTVAMDWEGRPAGTPPEDHTDTYVYGIDIVKTNESNERLTGAQFKLYTTQTGGTAISFVTLTQAQVEALGFVYEAGTNYYRVALAGEANTTDILEAGEFVVFGLDDDYQYYLEEVQAPQGYNILSGRTAVTATATLTGTTLSIAETEVENHAGSELPSTGGIGTTIFYVVGGLMMAAAVVLLATRKKMSVED